MTREQALDRYTETFGEIATHQSRVADLLDEQHDLRKILLATEYAPQRPSGRATTSQARSGATELRVLQAIREYGSPLSCGEVKKLIGVSGNHIQDILKRSVQRGLLNKEGDVQPYKYSLAVHKDLTVSE